MRHLRQLGQALVQEIKHLPQLHQNLMQEWLN